MLDRPELPVQAGSLRTALRSQSPNLPDVLRDAAERAMVLLPDADSVVVAVRRPAGPVELAATGSDGRRLDALQRGLREGPVFDAVLTGSPVASGDLTVDRRWPRLASCVGPLRMRSAASVPVGVDGTVLGTLTAYARRPAVFPADPTEGPGPLSRLAAQVGSDILGALELDGARAVIVSGELAGADRHC